MDDRKIEKSQLLEEIDFGTLKVIPIEMPELVLLGEFYKFDSSEMNIPTNPFKKIVLT